MLRVSDPCGTIFDMSASNPGPGESSEPLAAPERPAQESGTPSGPSSESQTQSPALQRFLTCRWRKGAEGSVPDYCTHRDVHPMAGTAGFTPDSWCLDCGFFKVRRAPRKLPPAAPIDRYYY